MEQVQCFLAAVAFGPGEARRVQQRRQQPATLAQMAPCHDVLERAHVEKDLQILERAPDAGFCECVRRRTGQLSIVESDATRARNIDAGQQVEERRFSSAVGADDRMDRTGGHLEGEILDSVDTSELLRQALDGQRAHFARRCK